MNNILMEKSGVVVVVGARGGGLLSIQLCRDASQRCFRDLVVACRGGGPSLTDERPNLLISPAKVEAGFGGGRVAALVVPGGRWRWGRFCLGG